MPSTMPIARMWCIATSSRRTFCCTRSRRRGRLRHRAVLAAASEATTYTQVGVTVGTPAYMSPEQAAGDPVDGRSDLFALGCVLYEMLTGQPAFSGPTVQSLIASRFVHTPPDVSSIRAAVPPALSDVVSRLLARSPEDRPVTGAMVVEALGLGMFRRVPRACRRHPLPCCPSPT